MATSQTLDKRWDTWYFQSRVGLKIDGCNETPLIDGKMYRAAGTCTISDSSGNLLFYSNSQIVLNKNHQIMPNGLLGSWGDGVFQYQGPIIIPMPQNDTLFYMFHAQGTNIYEAGNYLYDFNYNVINKNADGGNGDLVIKNKTLYRRTTEATAAVMHGNNQDYWIVTHKSKSDSFAVFKFTAAGLDTVPVYYKVGPMIGEVWRDKQIVIKFSPDRQKMIVSRNLPKADPLNYERDGGFDIYNFNDMTGEISDPISIRDGFTSFVAPIYDRYFATGAEFSPGSRYAYISTWDHIFQYDISVHDSAAINNTRIEVATTDIYSYGFGHILMGSNGKLYIAKFYSNDYLATIEKPDEPGAGCQYNPTGVYFPGLNYYNDLFLGYGLGNCIQPYVRTKPYSVSDMQVDRTCLYDTVEFSVRGLNADSIYWNFGDPSSGQANASNIFQPKHYYATGGNYLVRCIIYSACATDTLDKTIDVGNPYLDLQGIDSACQNDTIILFASTDPGVHYLWNNTVTNDSLTVTQNGQYWVQVSKDGCSVADTITITFLPLPSVSLGNDTTICNGQTLFLDATDPSIATYNWSTTESNPFIDIQTAGIYWLEATAVNGCKNRDTLNLSITTLPNFNLGEDTTLCDGQQLMYNFNIPGVSYLWNDGDNSGLFSVSASGLYWLNVTKDGCSKRDSINITYNPVPLVALGMDTVICEGSSFNLFVNSNLDAITWQNGSASNIFTVIQGGVYHVKVLENGCYNSDTITVAQKLKPKYDLGKDTAVCLEAGFLLSPGLVNVNYVWQNGSTSSEYLVKNEGLYQLSVTNECGTTTDKINIKSGPCLLLMPNAFTPNHDGKNDLWRIPYPGLVKTLQMRVYNRWGEKVFETNDPYKGWDGKYKGLNIDSGNFVWIIQYEDYTGKKHFLKGNLVLIR